mgnify:CR=1 FL=1
MHIHKSDFALAKFILLCRLILIITLKIEKFDNGNLKLGVITVDLSDIKDSKNNQIFKELLGKIKDAFKEDEFV